MSDKLKRVQRALAGWQLDAVLLTRRDNIAWLTDGATFHVVERSEVGVASLLITPYEVWLLAPDNELARIVAEEPMPFEYQTASYPWYQTLRQGLPDIFNGALGSDTPLEGTQDVADKLVQLRQGLSPQEQERFAELGREAATLLEQIARGLSPGISEQQIAAEIASRCLEKAIRPVCVLVAADERIASFKHPIPGPHPVLRKVMMTLGAERQGLHVSLTRIVHFGEPEPALRQRIQELAEIHVDIMLASRAGRAWQAIFSDIQQAYERQGQDGEWRHHHQGGPAGYGCRDWIVTPQTEGVLVPETALAWNPTLSGVKSEDTAMLTENGIAWLTRSGDWPLIDIQRGGQRWQVADWLIVQGEKS